MSHTSNPPLANIISWPTLPCLNLSNPHSTTQPTTHPTNTTQVDISFRKYCIRVLDETIGDVSDYNAYIKWILVANSLFFPKLKLPKDISLSLFQNNFPHRESNYVFSIDPEGCTDFDDAFSLQDNILSIYISNVPFFLEKLDLFQKN